MSTTIESIAESLAFLPSPSRSFSTFDADWHQDDRARPLVRQYQTTLDSVLQSHPELRGCIAYCTGLRDSLSHASPQRRSAELALSVRLPGAPSPAVFLPAEHGLLPNGGGKAKKKRLNGRRRRSQVPPAAAPQSDRRGMPLIRKPTIVAGASTVPERYPLRPPATHRL